MYENLLDKLTEQNFKLKDWIKTKKGHDKESNYQSALKHVELNRESECPTPPGVDVRIPVSQRSNV